MKQQNIKNISLSIILASLLVGCGSSGSSDNSGQPIKPRTTNYDSCVDLNNNLLCDSNEVNLNTSDYPNVNVTAQGSVSSVSRSVEDTNGLYLSGVPLTDKVSAFTTLVHNELKYNPLITTVEAAENYVKKQFGKASSTANSDVLSAAQNADFEASIKSAITSNKLKDKNNIVSAVRQSFYKTKSIVSVNSSEIDSQQVSLVELNKTAFALQDWQMLVNSDTIGKINDDVDSALVLQEGGERIVSLSGKNNRVIASSQYHNALTIIDYNEDPKINYNKFASFRVSYGKVAGGTGGTITPGMTTTVNGVVSPTSPASTSTSTATASSGGSARALTTDNQSNAITLSGTADVQWEHLLNNAYITNDGSTVFALIKPKIGDLTFNEKSTHGLFKIPTNNYGVANYNDSDTKVIDSSDIDSFLLNKQETRVIVYGDVNKDKDNLQKGFRIYDTNLGLINAGVFEDIESYTLNDGGDFIFATTKKTYLKKSKLLKINVNNLEVKEVTNEFSSDEIISYSNDSLVLLIDKSTGKTVTYNSSDLSLLSTQTLVSDVKHISKSLDNSLLAVAKNSHINLYNLNETTLPLHDSITIDETNGELSQMSFIGDRLLSLTQAKKPNAVLTYDLNNKKEAQNSKDRLSIVLNSLNSSVINDGKPLDYITTSLMLPTTQNNVNLKWSISKTLSNYIDTKTGEILRPKDDNVHGVLSVEASIILNGEASTATKTYNISIKKAGSVFTSTNTLHKINTLTLPGLQRKIISNDTGTNIISYTKLDDFYQGFNTFSITDDKLSYVQGNENDIKQLYRDELLNMSFKDNNTLIFVTVNNSYPSFSSIYTQNINFDGTLNDTKSGEMVIGNYGTPLQASISSDKSNIVVFRKHFDFENASHYADFYTNSGAKTTLVKKVRLKNEENKIKLQFNFENEISVNEDASAMYLHDTNSIYKHADKHDTILSKIGVSQIDKVYYFDSRVYATTKDGKIFSFDKDLTESSRVEFDLDMNVEISKLEYKAGKLYAFVEKKGLYVMTVNSSAITGYKYYLDENISSGAVSLDTGKAFILSNEKTKAYENIGSSITLVEDK